MMAATIPYLGKRTARAVEVSVDENDETVKGLMR